MYLGAKLQNRFIFSTIVTRKFNHFTFFVDMYQLPLRFFPFFKAMPLVESVRRLWGII